MQKIASTLLSLLWRACGMAVAAPFWLMAFIAFLLRLLVVRPLGPLLALSMGVVWCCGNVRRIQGFVQAVRRRFSAQ